MTGGCFSVHFQGPSQWVILEFPQRIRVSQLQIQFQGGFSSRRGCLEGTESPGSGERRVEGATRLHSLLLSLLQVLRAVRLSVRLWTSTLRTTTQSRYPVLASGVGVVYAFESCRPCL